MVKYGQTGEKRPFVQHWIDNGTEHDYNYSKQSAFKILLSGLPVGVPGCSRGDRRRSAFATVPSERRVTMTSRTCGLSRSTKRSTSPQHQRNLMRSFSFYFKCNSISCFAIALIKPSQTYLRDVPRLNGVNFLPLICMQRRVDECG